MSSNQDSDTRYSVMSIDSDSELNKMSDDGKSNMIDDHDNSDFELESNISEDSDYDIEITEKEIKELLEESDSESDSDDDFISLGEKINKMKVGRIISKKSGDLKLLSDREITRLARIAGITSLQSKAIQLIKTSMKETIKYFVEKLIMICEYSKRVMIKMDDLKYVLNMINKRVYYGGGEYTRCITYKPTIKDNYDSKALCEIEYYQKNYHGNFIIDPDIFKTIVRDMIKLNNKKINIIHDVTKMLQFIIEDYIIKLLQWSFKCCVHGNRKVISDKDISFAKNIVSIVDS